MSTIRLFNAKVYEMGNRLIGIYKEVLNTELFMDITLCRADMIRHILKDQKIDTCNKTFFVSITNTDDIPEFTKTFIVYINSDDEYSIFNNEMPGGNRCEF